MSFRVVRPGLLTTVQDLGRTVQGDERIADEENLRPEHGAFQRRSCRLVAYQGVRNAMRNRIHRPARHDAQVLEARAAKILHGRQQARAHNTETHCAALMARHS